MANEPKNTPTTPQAAQQAAKQAYAEQGVQPVLTGQDHRKAIADEYGAWVATQQIYVGSALAYNVGDPVPATNVQAFGYDKNNLVAKAPTVAGSEAVAEAAETPAS